jgi:hypothetical protein
MDELVKPLTTRTGRLRLRLPGRASQEARGSGGQRHFSRGAAAHAFGICIALNIGRQNRLVPLVDQVAHRLADEVVGHGETRQRMAMEGCPLLAKVFCRCCNPIDFEVVTTAG